MGKIRLLGSIVVCLLTLISTPSNAVTVSFDFTATVTNYNSFYLSSSSALVGQTGIGHIEYDLNPDYGGNGWYGFDVPDAVFTFQLPGISFISGSVPTTPTSVSSADVQVDVRNDTTTYPGGADQLIYWGNAISQPLEGYATRMALVFVDTTQSVLTNESLPSTSPNLSLFDVSNLQIQISTSPGTNTSGLTLSLDSVTGAVVPIPATVWLFGSGLLGLIGMARRKKSA